MFAFCLLPDHFHLLIQPNGKENISRVIKFFKENPSRDINRIIAGDTALSRLRLAGLIHNLQRQFHQKHPQKIFPPFKWQRSFHDLIIRYDKDLSVHHTSFENNFLKYNLSQMREYSSFSLAELIDVVEHRTSR